MGACSSSRVFPIYSNRLDYILTTGYDEVDITLKTILMDEVSS